MDGLGAPFARSVSDRQVGVRHTAVIPNSPWNGYMQRRDERQGPGDEAAGPPPDSASNDVAVNPTTQCERNEAESAGTDGQASSAKSGARRRRRKPFVL